MQQNKVNLSALSPVITQLAEIKWKLQTSNKPNFIIANICYYLRQPLTGVINMIDRMSKDPKELTQKNVNIVKKVVQALSSFVDDGLAAIPIETKPPDSSK